MHFADAADAKSESEEAKVAAVSFWVWRWRFFPLMALINEDLSEIMLNKYFRWSELILFPCFFLCHRKEWLWRSLLWLTYDELIFYEFSSLRKSDVWLHDNYVSQFSSCFFTGSSTCWDICNLQYKSTSTGIFFTVSCWESIMRIVPGTYILRKTNE